MRAFLIILLATLLVSGSGDFLNADEAKPAEAKKEAVEKKPSVKPAPAKPDSKPKKAGANSEKVEAPKKEADAESEKEPQEIHQVETGPMVVTAKVNGILRSTRNTPIALDLDQWTELVVIKAVPHGTLVKKGDVLVELDTESIREKIEALELGMPLKQLELETAQLNLMKLKKSTPVSLEKARKEKMQAEEDFAYFEDVSLPMRKKSAEQNVKQAEAYLSYAEEELNQLKKMYEADDLTEETEEIILQRAQNSVDDYRWRLEQTEERTERSLNTLIPREHETLRRNLTEKQLAWRISEKTIPDALTKAELEFKAKARSLTEARESLAEHRQDFEAMKVTAPHDGVVYYGMSQRGKWTTASTVERKLIPGAKLSMREIIMTVADPSKQELVLSIPENKLADLEKGQRGVVELTSDPEAEISGRIASISRVPYADNTFGGVLQLTKVDDEASLFPGMKAAADITVYETKEAVLVPDKAIIMEDDETLVTLKGGAKRKVETGHSADGNTEVLKGLKAGDEIVLSAGEAKKPADAPAPKEEKK